MNIKQLNEALSKLLEEDVFDRLEELSKSIENEEGISYDDIVFLQSHKKEIKELGDVRLAQWAGIPEEEW